MNFHVTDQVSAETGNQVDENFALETLQNELRKIMCRDFCIAPHIPDSDPGQGSSDGVDYVS